MADDPNCSERANAKDSTTYTSASQTAVKSCPTNLDITWNAPESVELPGRVESLDDLQGQSYGDAPDMLSLSDVPLWNFGVRGIQTSGMPSGDIGESSTEAALMPAPAAPPAPSASVDVPPITGDLSSTSLLSSSDLEHSAASDSGDAENGKQKLGKDKRRRQILSNTAKQNLICKICGERATGFNFGAITCESCKAFFRRNAHKSLDAELTCGFDNDCKMDAFNRKFCAACRLRKCLGANMKKEWILDEKTLQKRKKIEKKPKAATATNAAGDSARKNKTSAPVPLTVEQQAELDEILAVHAAIDSSQGNQPDLQRDPNDRGYTADDTEYEQITENPEHATQVLNMVNGFMLRFIPFIRKLRGCSELDTDDKIILIKQCMSETLAIRSAVQYDPLVAGYEIENANSGAKKCIHIEFIRDVFGDDVYQEHMKFVTTLNTAAKWDKQAMILIMVLNLFSPDRQGLQHKQAVSRAEEHYTLLLQAYLRSKYAEAEASVICSRLLGKLTDVRSYGEVSRKAFTNHAVTEAEGLAPLMKEILTDR